MMSPLDVNLCRAMDVINTTWQRLSETFMQRIAEGRPVCRFPDLSEAAADRASSEARAALALVEEVDIACLPHEVALNLQVARYQLETQAQALDRYWLAQDCGMDPAMFLIGPYGGRLLTIYAWKALAIFKFSQPGDLDRYLTLVERFADFVWQIHAKLLGQAVRGIRIPQPAIVGMRNLVKTQAAVAREQIAVNSARLFTLGSEADFAARVARLVQDRVIPAFAAVLDAIGPDYAARAPERVGMVQFADGARIYESLVVEHLSMRTTIDAVHRLGHERMARIESEMAEIRAQLAWADRESFHRYLRTDPRWVSESETDLQARFDEALRRIEPHIDSLFSFRPSAACRTARLDPRLESGMTYGYFQEPTEGHPDGVYYFNASNLSDRTLATAPSLIYHELIPGHHFHLASRKENAMLHPLRQHLLFTAFTEGWAEYAATLAGEIGMYAHPCERYGRLLFDAFLTSRLVVDTGMNALGWSLDRARQYMRERTLMSEEEILTETLRYSTDVPGKALAYKIGEIKIDELRRRVRDALEKRFDIREFHDIVLRSGGLPLDLLDWHVSRWLEQRH